MNPRTRAKYFTLDWDNISLDEAHRRVSFILDNYANVHKIVLLLSPIKGFHVKCYCYSDTNVADIRNELKDDGNRLIHDLMNRPEHIHDILWTKKVINHIEWTSEKLLTVTRI